MRCKGTHLYEDIQESITKSFTFYFGKEAASCQRQTYCNNQILVKMVNGTKRIEIDEETYYHV